MTQLRPCPQCQRHVKVDATECPFCSSAFEVKETPRRASGAVTRAALFAGAALLAPAACADKTPEPKEPDDTIENVERVDKIQTEKVDDTNDEVVETKDKEVVDTKETDDTDKDEEIQKEEVIRHRDIAKPYGAPPARSRLV